MVRFGFGIDYWVNKFSLDFNRALDEISYTGWDGVELSYDNYLDYYLDNVDELRKLLELHKLEFTTFYSHLILIDKDYIEVEIDLIKRKINLIKSLGSDILQLDGGKKLGDSSQKDYKYSVENIKRICELAHSKKLKPTWHQHWGTIFDNAESFEYLMENTKDAGLYFNPDTAQLFMSGMDPLETMEKYRDRINYIHLKDIKENDFINRYLKPTEDVYNNKNMPTEKYQYLEDRFLDDGCFHINSRHKITEIARGIIEFKPIVKLIKNINFNGWVVVDQDYTEYKTIESLDVNLKNLKYLFELE